jgi:hypothetical protein
MEADIDRDHGGALIMESFNWAGFLFPRRIVGLPHGNKADRMQAARAGNACGPYYTSPKPITGGAHGASGFYLGECMRMRWTWADDINGAGIRHRGWFCDEDQDQTIRGIVVRLTHGRMLAGWSMGEGMASSIDCDQIFTDEIEAARCADGLAESVAESEREYQERWRAAQELSDAAQEAQEQIRRLWSARHNDAVRELIRSCIVTARDSREQLTNEYSDIEV